MAGFRKSYGAVMTALIHQLGGSKGQDFFLTACRGDRDEWEFVLESEINAMSRAEFIDLMEEAGILQTAPETT